MKLYAICFSIKWPRSRRDCLFVPGDEVELLKRLRGWSALPVLRSSYLHRRTTISRPTLDETIVVLKEELIQVNPLSFARMSSDIAHDDCEGRFWACPYFSVQPSLLLGTVPNFGEVFESNG
ncbi:hypothetical protein MCOR02_004008 [Pyricularia oryzae]|uniref:Uncharacterized protein n=1 Tax=Pyricularia grisea TaxID=148305 RepID=A0ABQ8NMT2_PYRGI|nr:hypothetical protein MCOR01_005827 [Pyricularia oryzae]KAI6298537.1 hypothetical protein MCOR33_005325 [Pyricularia grisea]KAH9435049.1 hypothetical protein MCOR02_004008 [Pyricularia oryzae]KAI6311341.1 hypothetical protein MCOR29_008315 [Pyricularia oryzae]KAI6342918.1 hypothetical protein MCOR30_001735 [Pyricularia oryzae]